MQTDTARQTALMERNLRLLPWWWALRWMWLGGAIWAIYLIEERGLTAGQVLLFEAAFAAVTLTAEMPTGMLADRFGRRPVLLAASLTLAAAYVAFGLARGIGLLLGSYALWGVGVALMSGADQAFLFDTLRVLGRGGEFTRRMGRMDAISGVSFAVVTMVGSAMVLVMPLAAPVVASSIFGVVSAAVCWRLTEPPAVRSKSFAGTARSAARRMLGTPALALIVALMAATSMASMIVWVVYQPLAVEYGAPVWSLGVATVFLTLSGSAGSWSAWRIGGALGLPRALALLAAGAALAPLAGAAGTLWVLPLFALAPLTTAALFPLVSDFIARRVSDDMRATALSMNSLAMSIAAIVVAPGVGLLIDGAGMATALTVTAAVLFVLAAAAYLLWMRAGDTAAAPRA